MLYNTVQGVAYKESKHRLHNIEKDLVMQGEYKYTALININNK